MDLSAVQSVSITVDVSTSAVSLTNDTGVGLKAGVSQLQTSVCLKPPAAGSMLCLSVLYHSDR